MIGPLKYLLDEQFGLKTGHKTPTISMLTERESEVLTLLAAGLSNKLIADKLNVSMRTIQTHRQRIMRKLDVHTAVELTRFAIARGLSDLQRVK